MPTEGDGEQGAPRGRRLARAALRGLGMAFAGLVVVAIALGVLAELACRQRLAERRAAWPVESAAAAARQAAPRPVLVVAPTQGNAAHDYAAMEWILDPRAKWPQTLPPGVAPPVLPRGFATKHDLDALRRAAKELERGDPLPDDAAAVVSALAPVARHLTDGVSRPVCDWALPLGPGGYELPDLLALRLGAQLRLAVARGDPDALARAGLEVACFGQDVGRIPTIIGTMFGLAIEHMGLRAVEAALSRGLRPETLRQVVRVLAALRPPTLDLGLVTDRLATEVQITILEPALLAELNRASYVGFFERGAAIARAPYVDRARLDPNLAADMAASKSMFMLAMPDLAAAAVHVDESEVARGAVRLLAAAQLHRLERGGWPPDLAALAPFAGGPLPGDPFQGPGATLSLAVKDGELRIYSWGSDGVDDGGATTPKRWDAPDYTFVTR